MDNHPIHIEYLKAVLELGEYLANAPTVKAWGSEYYFEEVVILTEGVKVGKFIYLDDAWQFQDGDPS